MRRVPVALLLCLVASIGLACAAPGAGGGSPGAGGSGSGGPAGAAASAPAPSGSGAAPAASQAAQPPRPVTVRFANAGIAAQAPTFLALEHGYFRELGIELEIHELTSSNDMVALLSGDQLDVGHQAISPALFNAAARGVGVRMVADHGGNIQDARRPAWRSAPTCWSRTPGSATRIYGA